MGAFLEITPNSEFVETFVGKQILALCEFCIEKLKKRNIVKKMLN
jgi:hypothetical protein